MASRDIQMQVAGCTDVGLIREHNEDNLLVVDLGKTCPEPLDQGDQRLTVGERGALLLVCDGMGGAAAGEVASRMAVDIVSSFMSEQAREANAGKDGQHASFARTLRLSAYEANRKIFEAARDSEEHAGMGTTMTAVGVAGGALVMAQVGDSRAYVLRRGTLTQVTRDQSLVNQLLETGQITEEQARLFEHSNVILQALGVQEEVEVLLSTVPLRRGDRVLVCTDGLTGVVCDEDIAATLAMGHDMTEACRALVEMARAAGGPDNITVVCAAFDGEELPVATAADEVRYERWRLDEPAEPNAPTVELEAVIRAPGRRLPPARTFFSLMLLVAIALGGLVAATELRRAGVRCEVVGPPGCALHVDGYDVGRRTHIDPITVKLPPGRHQIGLRGRGAPRGDRTIEVTAAEVCKVSFDDALSEGRSR